MTPLRTLAVVAGSAAFVALAAGLAAPAGWRAPPVGEASPVAAPRPSPPPGERVRVRGLPDAARRPRVPAGILARAADARALDPGPSCAPAAAPPEAPPCPPESRESIEIEWNVGPDR